MVLLTVIVLILVLNFDSSRASFKTGLCVSPQTENLNCDDFNALTSPVWWYNWGTVNLYQQMNCIQLRNVEFIPMIWGYYGGNLSNVNIPDDTTTILGFNEPNIVGQAELQPADAVEGWKALQTAFHDKILVSPSASPCSGLGCAFGWTQTAWFDEFFRICNGTCRVDYMAVHFYWCYTNDAQFNVYDWIGSLQNIYNRYGYKLWLTEFNCWNATATEQKTFMESVIPVIESKDWIVKYAWFMARTLDHTADIQLFTKNVSKSKLTALGETYNKYSLSPTMSPTSNPTIIPSATPTNNPTDVTSNLATSGNIGPDVTFTVIFVMTLLFIVH